MAEYDTVVAEANEVLREQSSFKEQFTVVSSGTDAVKEHAPRQLNAYDVAWEPLQLRIASLVVQAQNAVQITDASARKKSMAELKWAFGSFVKTYIPDFLTKQSRNSCTACIPICVNVLTKLADTYNVHFQGTPVSFVTGSTLQKGECASRMCPIANGFLTCWLQLRQTTVLQLVFWSGAVFLSIVLLLYVVFVFRMTSTTAMNHHID